MRKKSLPAAIAAASLLIFTAGFGLVAHQADAQSASLDVNKLTVRSTAALRGNVWNPTGNVVIADRLDARGTIFRTGGPVIIGDTVRIEGSISRTAGPVLIKDGLDITGGNLTVGSGFTVNKATGRITTASVDATSVVDTTRAVNIPLTTFIDCQTDAGAQLDFSSGADVIADFVNSATDGQGATIRFDDTSGTEDQASEICSTFTVPPDYASGGEFRIRALKDAHAGATEVINCGVSVDGAALGTVGTVTTTGLASTSYTCTPGGTFAVNSSVNGYLSITSGTTMDDAVDVAGVEFVYTATQ